MILAHRLRDEKRAEVDAGERLEREALCWAAGDVQHEPRLVRALELLAPAVEGHAGRLSELHLALADG
jgi:hypothetical protein